MIPIRRNVTTNMRGKNQRDFLSLLVSSALTVALTVIIWAVTGAGSFWPIWVIFGLSVVLIGSALRAFAPPPSSSRDDPDHELDRD